MDDENKGTVSTAGNFFGQRPWLRWVLLGSVAINLFFIGTVASHFVFDNRMGGRPPMADGDPLKHAFREYVFSRPKVERLKIHVIMRKSFREIRPEFRNFRSLNERVADLIEAETVDQNALKKALEQLNDVKGRLELRGRKAIFEQILTFPLEARRKIAENMRRGPRGMIKRGHHDRKRKRDGALREPEHEQGNMPKGEPVGQQ